MMKAKPVHSTLSDTTQAVDAFMSQLDHPFKAEIQSIRASILGVDARIAEGVKWNAPSFRTTEYFATTNLREKKGVGVILHLGAKARNLAPQGLVINDANNLLSWLAKDRAMLVFADTEDFSVKQPAFEVIIRNWIKYV